MRLKKFALFVVTGLVAGASYAAPPKWCAEGKPVKLAGITWESGQFYSELIRLIVRDGYGCKTETVTGSTAVTEAALVSQDIQIWAEQWNRTDVIKNGVKAGKITLVGNTLLGGTEEGWYVPEYVVKGDPARNIKPMAPDLKSIADLPKYKNLFPDDGRPEKGRFLNCPAGWDCEGINNQKFKAYKLNNDYVNFRPGTGGSLDATIMSAYTRGKPVLFYYWTPASLLGKVKVVKLEEPAFNEACWKTIGPKATTDDVCPSATPQFTLAMGVSNSFKKDAPEIVDVISKLQVTREVLNSTLADMAARKVGADVMAKEFVKKNRPLVNSWLNAEAVANLDAKLK